VKDLTNPAPSARIRYQVLTRTGWLLGGTGPDGDFDLKPERWMAEQEAAADSRWLGMQYDPTNGATSNGDVIVASWQSAAPEVSSAAPR